VTTLAESVWAWAMGKGLKDLDAAWQFDRWMSFEEGHRQLMVGMGRGTMVRDVISDPAYKKTNPRIDLTIAAMNRATPLPQSKGWERISPIILGLPADVLQGSGKDHTGPKLGVRDAVAQAARAAQVELDDVYRAR
jgi:ABC-type glycerol-3-phosphate transport system substrate-binding protein